MALIARQHDASVRLFGAIRIGPFVVRDSLIGLAASVTVHLGAAGLAWHLDAGPIAAPIMRMASGAASEEVRSVHLTREELQSIATLAGALGDEAKTEPEGGGAPTEERLPQPVDSPPTPPRAITGELSLMAAPPTADDQPLAMLDTPAIFEHAFNSHPFARFRLSEADPEPAGSRPGSAPLADGHVETTNDPPQMAPPDERPLEAPRSTPTQEVDRKPPSDSGADGMSAGVDRPPTVAHLPRPIYPRMSQRLGEQGMVILSALVDERGHVCDIRVVQSPGHPRLVRAAIDALKVARFDPARRDGRTVSCWVAVPIRFVLK